MNKAILLVEDDLGSAMQIRRCLEMSFPEAHIVHYPQVEPAIAIAREIRFDVCILDIHLPDGNGIYLLTDHLRVTQPEAAAILMTAMPISLYAERSQKLGVLRLMQKPLDFTALRELIRNVMRRGTAPGFSATLNNLTPLDLIQLKCLSKATGVVRFDHPNGVSARIHFKRGQIVHANFADEDGESALTQIIRFDRGYLEDTDEDLTRHETIHKEWQTLLLDSCTALDDSIASGIPLR